MKKLISDILAIITPKEKSRITLFIFFNTIINLADVFSVVCLLFVVKFYTQPLAVSNTFLLSVLPGKNSLLPVLALIIMFTIKNVAGHWVYKTQAGFVSNVAVRISQQNLSNYLEGPYSDYANVDSAVFVRKIIHQPTEFAQYVLQSAQQIITELLLIAFSITALMIYNARLFVIVFLTMLPAIIILGWLTKKRLENIKRNIKVVVEQSLQYLNEALMGYVESNIYSKNSFFVNRHRDAQKRVGHYVINIQTTQDLPARFFEVFAILGLFVLIAAIKYATAASNTDVVIIGAFIAAAYKIIPSISRIINLSGQIRTYRYTVGKPAKHFTPRKINEATHPIIESVELRNIHFSYNELKVLDGFNCHIPAASFIGISGDSGSGKTTAMQLLLGFITQASGLILFNDEVLNANERITRWDKIAYVKQEPFILHDSILNNIVLFDDDYDHHRLNEILAVTGLKDIADRFSEGINKQIMEGGKNLSGGQRKRIAIARALYKNVDVLLLDEPFSELDELSELAMLQYLKQLALSGKIVILISHSLNSFKLCDRVINIGQN